ncbi:hypothetical protein CBI38_30720 (plasmid) [Rhodococcus oxybenzonivorans]|jgi:hypothetical protein|uniref:Uncharacterized protein n=2 Tax=Rhodococcus TaxID=1827 RepID=A0A2S2C510_9NOCA|nr:MULTISPECIES: hypothetical protein [Rhodococcus]AWK75981.1 hypothetical protein CBI38_30720 [Rhodococcus oxybenzonivorans]EID78850.1 hypothetical protein W59_16669 [Rhodococcus opacus RKJ300 = JCM 13270]QQZ19762.1 hypothetical protein GO592_42975 [Rhodococcus sp. 21391]
MAALFEWWPDGMRSDRTPHCRDTGTGRGPVDRGVRVLMAAVLGVLVLAMAVPVPANAEPLYPWQSPIARADRFSTI